MKSVKPIAGNDKTAKNTTKFEIDDDLLETVNGGVTTGKNHCGGNDDYLSTISAKRP